MNFILRPWNPEDLDDLVSYANNFAIAQNMTNRFPHPYTAEAGKKFIQIATANIPLNIFTIAIEGKASGGIGLHLQEDVFCKNAELGYWLAQPFWGKGIITNAVKQMVDYGFKTFDIDRIFARPFGTNYASQRVLEKSGFKLEAEFKNTIYKNGEYKDELIFAIRKN